MLAYIFNPCGGVYRSHLGSHFLAYSEPAGRETLPNVNAEFAVSLGLFHTEFWACSHTGNGGWDLMAYVGTNYALWDRICGFQSIPAC